MSLAHRIGRIIVGKPKPPAFTTGEFVINTLEVRLAPAPGDKLLLTAWGFNGEPLHEGDGVVVTPDEVTQVFIPVRLWAKLGEAQ
jgi:hypothetical protein